MLISKRFFFCVCQFIFVFSFMSNAEKIQCKYILICSILHCIGSFCFFSFFFFLFGPYISHAVFRHVNFLFLFSSSVCSNPFLAFGPRIKRLESSFSISFSTLLFFIIDVIVVTVFYIFFLFFVMFFLSFTFLYKVYCSIMQSQVLN